MASDRTRWPRSARGVQAMARTVGRPRPGPRFTRSTIPSIGRTTPTPTEDRKTAGPYKEPENDQYDPEDDVARKEQHDPRDHEDCGGDPQDETHVTIHAPGLPSPSSFHTRARLRINQRHYSPCSSRQRRTTSAA